MASDLILEVERLGVAYGPVVAVHDLDLRIERGASVALLGANGAGKTSAVEAIAGLLPKRAGRVAFDGHDITASSASRIARCGLALVPQGRELFPTFSVDETLIAGAAVAENRPPGDPGKIYEIFPRLYEKRRQLAGRLSGGEQQMLAIGRALMSSPRMLVLDEPSAGLAALVLRDVVAAVRKIRAGGVAMLVVEQNLELAAELAERCLVMSTGVVRWSGPMREAFDNEEIREAYFA